MSAFGPVPNPQMAIVHGYLLPVDVSLVVITRKLQQFDQSGADQSYLFLFDDERLTGRCHVPRRCFLLNVKRSSKPK